jgi:outer membrane murein-binding lipoprotein Lpp
MASWTMKLGAVALCAAALAGCASTPKESEPGWVGGDTAHLAADKAACRQDSASIDPNSVSGYSDPRYGVTSAMSAAVAKSDPLADHSAQAREAAFAACMGDKGWHQP